MKKGSEREVTGKYANVPAYIGLILLACITLAPLLWALSTSLKIPSEVIQFPPTVIPSVLDFSNYYKVLFGSNFLTYFRNSVVVTGVSLLISTVLSMHCAYAVARFDIPHKNALMFGILMTSMIPTVALLIPLYIMAVQLDLYNTRLWLILIYTGWRTPVLTWMMRGFFEQIPKELEEAALIDGCSKVKAFYTVILPISQTALASSALLTAVYVWNDFLVSFTFVTDENLKMLSVGLYSYVTQYGIQWGELMAAVCLSIIPIIILFVCLQKRFVAGMAAGAVKG